MSRQPWRLGERASGLLLHPTCLPGPHGCGDLGREAHRFVEQIAAAGQRCWQMLPISPTPASGTPYDSPSVFAGSELLISLEGLYEEGWLRRNELEPPTGLPRDRVDYAATRRFRLPRLARACERFQAAGGMSGADYLEFCEREAST